MRLRHQLTAVITVGLSMTLSACGEKTTAPDASPVVSSANSTGTAPPTATSTSSGGAPSTAPSAPIAGMGSYTLCPSMDPNSASPASFAEKLAGSNIVDKGSQTVFGFPINYTVVIAPSLSVQASPSQSSVTTSLNIVSVDPSSIQATAQQTASQASGTSTTTFTSGAARAALAAAAPSWANIFCTLQPASQVVAATGAGSVTVAFNPPIPNVISPLAAAASYSGEIPAPLTFSTQATVQQSGTPAVAMGTSYPGTVTVQSVSPILSATDGSGNPVNVTADVAYSITSNFGSSAITGALGLLLSATFYIDTTAHTYKAIVAQTSNTTAPQVIFTSN